MQLAVLDLNNSTYLDKKFEDEICIGPQIKTDFDSFHNSFWEGYWQSYTTLKNVGLALILKGIGTARIIRKIGHQVKIIKELDYSFDHFSELIFSLPVGEDRNSRLYLQLQTTSECKVKNFCKWITDDIPGKNIKLALIMCTFNKQEYVKRNLDLLLSNKDFLQSGTEIFVIDNASNLELEKNERLHLIAQRNYGGAGGFTRGLLEARLTKRFSHYQFMDDDILLTPESILRGRAFMCFTKKDYSFSGAMLCMDRKNILWESGANYLNSKKLLSTDPCFLNQELNSSLLDKIASPYDFDYGGWWFYCFSNKALEKVGYPMPFFIRGDDVEFSLRLRVAGITTISLPGVGVWHEAFYNKTQYWMEYFNFRNYIILSLIHFNLSKIMKMTGFVAFVSFTSILFFEYTRAEAYIMALKDVFKSLVKLPALSSPEYHAQIFNHFKDKKDQEVPYHETSPLPKGGFFPILLKVLTLNTHLGGGRNQTLNVDSKGWRTQVIKSNFRSNTFIVNNEKSGKAYVFTKSFTRFAKTFFPMILYITLFFLTAPFLSMRFRQLRKTYSTESFWRSYLT